MQLRLGRHGIPARTRGQAFVELALMAPVLVLILAIVVDLSRVFTVWIAVTNSAREAAYSASQSPAGSVSLASIQAVAAGEGSGAQILADATHVVVSYPSPDLIDVTVRSQFQPIAPMVGAIWGGQNPWISAHVVFPLPLATS